MLIQGIEAVLFDMDGTLIDSECNTERAVDWLLGERSIPHADLDLTQFHGISWNETEKLLAQRVPELAGEPLATILQEKFHSLLLDEFPPLIQGAREALAAAGRTYSAAIVTSSNRQSVELLVEREDLRHHLQRVVCADDYTRSKPDPECYLLAADKLGCAPRRCLVFEDSLVGLQAAKSAGMWAVAIVHNKQGQELEAARAIADHTIENFTELAHDFFTTIGQSVSP